MSIPGAASPLFIGAAAAEAGPFQIDRSLRFDRAASSYLNRTPASAGNRRTFTFSCWHKKTGVNSSNRYILFNSYASGSVYFSLEFETEKLKVFDGGAISGGLATDGLFRDPSAWYHIVCAIDTTDGTAANRVKLYVNGVQQTLTGTQPSQNSDLGINTTTSMLVGAIDASGIYHNLDGYLAETHFIDGQALAPTDFGETDGNNNWNPKAYSGSYGTNGFHLDFSDTSDLGADAAGSNDWTPNNLVGTAPGLSTANEGFDVVTYTGNGSTQSITGLNFQPDFVWLKKRSGAADHYLYDQVRGATYRLYSNTTDAESTSSTGLTAFTSDGFTVGSANDVNQSSNTYVAWCWNAGANSNKTYTVKVVSDSGNKYRFDDFGTSAVTLDLQEGSTYIFDQSDSSNSGHPLRFSTTSDGTHNSGSEYTTGVTTTGTPGSAGAKTTIVVASGAPTLYYYCSSHSGMGGQADTNSTAGASNFDGSIQSVVKATTTYGFSIATFTVGTTPYTVGHGLGAVPKMIILKSKSNSTNWVVYHASTGNQSRTYLNLTLAASSGENYLNSTSPTSSVFTLSSSGEFSGDMVAYCWSEISGFSKFGSYTGNGSTTGPIVTTGFKPRFILWKRTDSADNWAIVDSQRSGSNPMDDWLGPNSSGAESANNAAYAIDFLIDGFQIKATHEATNASGGTYIYAAFASKPSGEVIDSLIDTPTNYEAGSGNNGGNYATWNALSSSGVTLSNGNLDATNSNSSTKVAASTVVPTAKCYWEVTVETPRSGGVGGVHGVNAQGARPDHSGGAGIYLADASSGGGTYVNGTKTAADYTGNAGDVIGFAYDPATRELIITRNGASVGTLTAPNTDNLQPVSALNQNLAINVNFGQRPFSYTPPTGYKSLCSTNLPDPTIADGSTVFDAKLWTGTGSSQSINTYNFSPDLVWAKGRSAATSHDVYDIIRGPNVRLRSNGNDAEVTRTNALNSFDSNGFTVGADPTGNINQNNVTMVGWAWDAGSSTVSNTDGSITSNVRANASAGFSIVSYTGNGTAGATIGHGLNAVPEFMLVKRRDYATYAIAYHKYIDATAPEDYFLRLFNTETGGASARVNSAGAWNDTAPTSSVFTVKSSNVSNASGATYIAYIWTPVAGYSAFGSYTGNGSTDGPFNYTGMRPRFIMYKESTNTGNWNIHDTSRNTYNQSVDVLFANLGNVETDSPAGSRAIDVLANGFKIRGTDSDINTSSETYVWIAFAEHPFKTARAR